MQKNDKLLWIVTLPLLFFFYVFQHPIQAINRDMSIFGTESNNSNWQSFIKNVRLQISTDLPIIELNPKDHLAPKKYPVFKILLQYQGEKSIELQWDENFGRVLWHGDLVLISEIQNQRESSQEMKFRTSNTYNPGKFLKLKKGVKLISTLSFTDLPGTYLKNLFNNRGKVIFFLCVKKKDSKNTLIPVSNKLTIIIK